MVKICNTCKQEKELTEFYKRYRENQNKYIFSNKCKECDKEINKKYRESVIGKIIRKTYQEKYNKSEAKKMSSKRYAKSEKGRMINKEYQQLDKCKEWHKEYRQSERGKLVHARSKKKHRETEKYRKTMQKYNQLQSVKDRSNAYKRTAQGRIVANERVKNKKQNDINYKMKLILSKAVCSAIKYYSKKGIESKRLKTMQLIGCSIEKVKDHLESQFTTDMTWRNHGKYGWHVDHRKPCSLFDLSKEAEQKKCFNFRNLQPMWWIDNIKKSNKFTEKDKTEWQKRMVA